MKKIFYWIMFLALSVSFSLSAQERNYYAFQEYYIAQEPYPYNEDLDQICLDYFEYRKPILEEFGGVLNYIGLKPTTQVNVWSCKYDHEFPENTIHLGAFVSGLCQKHDHGPYPEQFSYVETRTRLDQDRGCYCQDSFVFDESIQWCNRPIKDDGCPAENGTDNPCNVATGNKFRLETDISNNVLSFSRIYNSRYIVNNGLGYGWRSNHQKRLLVSANKLILVSAAGRGEVWRKNSGVWRGDKDSDYLIAENVSGYRVIKKDGAFEDYDTTGQIVSETDTNGSETLYGYDVDDNLSQVTNHYGQSLIFTYIDGYLATVTDPLGAVYKYEYDVNNNLVTVIYPDSTTDDSDNPRKIYHYENNDFPNHLTGITDEGGNRYATFAYDENGKAVLSELGTTTNPVGQEKIELDYQGAN